MPILAALSDQQDELGALLQGLGEDGWQRPSRCPGWTVSDVVLHLAQTNELAAASARGAFPDALNQMTSGAGPASSVDEGADAMVAIERGQPGSAVLARWRQGVEDLRSAFHACDPHARVVWVAGELSAQTLATTRLAETWIHTGDVAAGLGHPSPATDRLWHIARLAWRTVPYAFVRAGRELRGEVAFELRSPGGDMWEFQPEARAATVIRGDAEDLCLVAGQRAAAGETSLQGEGPDADGVLELVRTFA